jgi:hypothetical protein
VVFPQIHLEFQEKLQFAVNKLLSELDERLHESDRHDYSVYTGTSGLALLYFVMSRKLDSTSYAEVRLYIYYCRKFQFFIHIPHNPQQFTLNHRIWNRSKQNKTCNLHK